MKTSKIVLHSIVTLASIFTLYVIYNTNPVFSAKLFQELRNLSLNTWLTAVTTIAIYASGIAFIVENFKNEDKISNYTLFICTILVIILSVNLFFLLSIIYAIGILVAILGSLIIFYVFNKVTYPFWKK